MGPLYKRPICVLSGFTVPWLVLVSPSWLSLSGVGPCWAVLWLLPWALEDGWVSGMIAGFFLGILLDAISLGGATYVPALVALGWWWGKLGRRSPLLEGSLNLGLLAWIGSAVVGLSLGAQFLVKEFGESIFWLLHWSFLTLLSQSIVTGLVAPIIASLLLLLWRRKRPIPFLEKTRLRKFARNRKK